LRGPASQQLDATITSTLPGLGVSDITGSRPASSSRRAGKISR
jgi:hypothetical protein